MAGILRESYILCSKKEEEEEEEEERIIHPVLDLWSKLKFVYSARAHTQNIYIYIYIYIGQRKNEIWNSSLINCY